MKEKIPTIIHILRFTGIVLALGPISIAIFSNKPAPETSWQWVIMVIVAFFTALISSLMSFGPWGILDFPSAFDYDSSNYKNVKKANINNFYLMFIVVFAWQLFIIPILSVLKF